MQKSELIKDIIDIEWPMFSGVNNLGGKASCQMDPQTFRIMRESQYATWSEALLGRYLEDLRQAKNDGRNVMSEKYARMMEHTFPQEFAMLAPRLPRLDPEAARMVEEIVAAHLKWKEELDAKYPALSERGRPLRSKDDYRFGQPSLETYMRGELQTLSPAAVAIYHRETMDRLAQGRSEAEENLLNQVKKYGFTSLDEANRHVAANQA